MIFSKSLGNLKGEREEGWLRKTAWEMLSNITHVEYVALQEYFSHPRLVTLIQGQIQHMSP
jgi:hypothetical protein